MSSPDTPDFPIITWEVPIQQDYEITVTINAVGSKRAIIRGSYWPGVFWRTDSRTGDLLLYGYSPSYNSAGANASVPFLLRTVVNTLMSAPSAPTARFPDGGFNLTSPIGSIGIKYVDSGDPTVSLGLYARIEMTSVQGGLGGTTIDFGSAFSSFWGWDTQTENWSANPGGNIRRSLWNPSGVWKPQNRTIYEDRDSTANTYSSVSVFNSNTYRTITWSNKKEQLLLEVPFVYASQIWKYRRSDPGFATPYFRTADPNNLFEDLVSGARAGRRFRIYWSFDEDTDEVDYEEFFISDPEFMSSVRNNIEDISDNRGKLFRVTIPFTKYEF